MTRRPTAWTWAWFGLLLLGSSLVVWQVLWPLDPTAPEEHAAGAARLIAVPETEWTSVELLDANGLRRFERDAAGRWLFHEGAPAEPSGHVHQAEPGSAGRASAVFDTFSRASVERRIALESPAGLALYGLDRPQLIVLIRAAGGQPVLTLEVGQLAPDALSRYVHLRGAPGVLTLPDFHIAGLVGLVAPASLPASAASR